MSGTNALTPEQLALAETFLAPIESEQQLRDWMFIFLGIDFPSGHIDPDSNSSPVGWLFKAYTIFKENLGNEHPNIVVYSSRDSYKTLSCSALEVLIMVHFNLTAAHMAAIKSQSAKAVQYVNMFMRKIDPYLAHFNRKVTSQNKSNISITDEDGTVAYLSVVVCTMQGANSEHTNFMCVDEIDVVQDPNAFQEAKLIPGVLRGRYPVTIMTSTRKFAFGLMQKEIELASENKDLILHWNLLDITEKCQPIRNRRHEENIERYIAKRLPLKHITESEYDALLDEHQDKYEKIEAFAGCADCKLLPVCKTRLANRPDKDVGGLYKPIDFTINQFKKIDNDMAEAQLLCWKPSSSGLVYPRFVEEERENTLTIAQAWEEYTGEEAPKGLTLDDLIEIFHRKGIPFYIGGDWGFRHAFALIAGAVLPSGQFWIFETLAIQGLEFDDMMKYSKYMRDKYLPKKWFMDTAQPMFIKSFRKAKMPCKDFKKDILGGIESIRGQVVDASNRRRLKVIKTEENEFLIKGFRHHHFKMDAQGNITKDPDDEDYADAMDSLRYMGQNLFSSKGNIRTGSGENAAATKRPPNKAQSDIITNKILELTRGAGGSSKGKTDSGSVLWDFSDPFK